MNNAELLAGQLPDGTEVARDGTTLDMENGWPKYHSGQAAVLYQSDKWELVKPAPPALPETELWERGDIQRDRDHLSYQGCLTCEISSDKRFKCWRFRHPVTGAEVTHGTNFRLWHKGKSGGWCSPPDEFYCYPFAAYAAEIFVEVPESMKGDGNE